MLECKTCIRAAVSASSTNPYLFVHLRKWSRTDAGWCLTSRRCTSARGIGVFQPRITVSSLLKPDNLQNSSFSYEGNRAEDRSVADRRRHRPALQRLGLPNRLRLHISPSLGFGGYYSVFLSLSAGVIFPRRGETGLNAVYVIDCVENNL